MTVYVNWIIIFMAFTEWTIMVFICRFGYFTWQMFYWIFFHSIQCDLIFIAWHQAVCLFVCLAYGCYYLWCGIFLCILYGNQWKESQYSSTTMYCRSLMLYVLTIIFSLSLLCNVLSWGNRGTLCRAVRTLCIGDFSVILYSICFFL